MFISEKEIEVRYAETDQMGVVYHANYVIWLELAVRRLLKDVGFSYAGMEKDGYIFASDECEYTLQIIVKYGETVVCKNVD